MKCTLSILAMVLSIAITALAGSTTFRSSRRQAIVRENPDAPRFNGTSVVGIRPATPFLYFDLLSSWLPHAGPGHWPDADMIPLGHICQRNCDVRPDRWTRFSRDEQVTLLSLWALAPSPLMLGMNLPDNDEWTTSLLTNAEVLAVNQDPLGLAARRDTDTAQNIEIWMKQLSDQSLAVGFFNRTDSAAKIELLWQRLGFASDPQVRDLWARKDLGRQKQFAAELAPHGCTLLRAK